MTYSTLADPNHLNATPSDNSASNAPVSLPPLGIAQPLHAPNESSDAKLALDLVLQVRDRVHSALSATFAKNTEQLHATIASLAARLAAIEAAVGTSDPAALGDRFRRLEGQLDTLRSSLTAIGAHLGSGDLVDFVLQTDLRVTQLQRSLDEANEELGGLRRACGSAPPLEVIEQQRSTIEELRAALGALSENHVASPNSTDPRGVPVALALDERPEAANESLAPPASQAVRPEPDSSPPSDAAGAASEQRPCGVVAPTSAACQAGPFGRDHDFNAALAIGDRQ